MNEQTIKLECKLDTYKGNLTVNILDVLEQLNDEQKQDIISDDGWWSIIEKDMAKKIVNEFSRENYNKEYTKLRRMILNSESMPSVIREWAVSTFESLESAREKESYWSQAYWTLYHWIHSEEMKHGKMPMLPEHSYGKAYSKECMKSVEEKIKEWGLLFPDPVEKELE